MRSELSEADDDDAQRRATAIRKASEALIDVFSTSYITRERSRCCFFERGSPILRPQPRRRGRSGARSSAEVR
jgi:hypothetical protein